MTTTEKFVNSVLKHKNIKANRELEKILREKCAKKMSNVLKSLSN